MPFLDLSAFNVVCTAAGLVFLLFGLVSHLVQEQLYISAPVVSLATGALLPRVLPVSELLSPLPSLQSITLSFCRLVLGIQLVLGGTKLPCKYVWTERRSLLMLLGPGMLLTWLCASTVIFLVFPIDFLGAMAVGACLAPTDPILCNNIVTGKFAHEHMPIPLRTLMLAESGANDGLGYPFLFAALYLIRFVQYQHEPWYGFALWGGKVWLWTILFGIVYGVIASWLMRKALYWARKRELIDYESLLFSSVALALFVVGSCGILVSDDVLAAFAAGCVFNWDDRYRSDTMENSFAPTIDMVLNILVFMWLGAAAPWDRIWGDDVAPFTNFVLAAVGILLLRRLPVILLLKRAIPQMNNPKEAALAGFFGPIGVSAMYYLYLSLEFVGKMEEDFKGPEEERLGTFKETIWLVVWFSVISSVVVHGLSISSYKACLAIFGLKDKEVRDYGVAAKRGELRFPVRGFPFSRSSLNSSVDKTVDDVESVASTDHSVGQMQEPNCGTREPSAPNGSRPESFMPYEEEVESQLRPRIGERQPLLRS